jgi:hypothetical protein
MSPAEKPQGRFVRAIPLVMLAVFVVFWSAIDVLNGYYFFTIPSVLILAAVLTRLAVQSRREKA